MCWRLCLAAVLVLYLAGPVLAGEDRAPLMKIAPLRDGRYLLEPLSGFAEARRNRGNSQPSLNLPARPRAGGQNLNGQSQAGPAASGFPAGRPGS